MKLIKHTFFMKKCIGTTFASLYTDTSYPFVYYEADGNYLVGSSSYKLTIPANVPAANFWSLTLYDVKSSSDLRNCRPFPSISSLNKLEYNEDDSLDLYFGPDLPEDAPKSNYLKTVSGEGWFSQLRLYSPTQDFYDQTWQLGNFEKITQVKNDEMSRENNRAPLPLI